MQSLYDVVYVASLMHVQFCSVNISDEIKKETKSKREKRIRINFEDQFSDSFVIFMFFHFPKEASTDAALVDGGSCTE